MKHALLGLALVLNSGWAGCCAQADEPAAAPGPCSLGLEPLGNEEREQAAGQHNGVNALPSGTDSTISVKRLLGISVSNPLGEDVGEISDLELDVSGCLTSVVIHLGGFMGVGGEYVSMPLGKIRIERGERSSEFSVTVLETRDHILRTHEWEGLDNNRD